MTTRIWTITTELSGRSREVEVHLYDSLGEMRRAATKFGKRIGEEIENGHFNGALAVTHGFRRYSIDADAGREVEQPAAAILRLVRGHLWPEVISHEVAHLAQWLYRIDTLETCGDDDDKALDHFNSDNEPFAYMLGGLFATIWDMLEGER